MKRLNITLQAIEFSLTENGQAGELQTDTFTRALGSMLPRGEISEYSIRHARGRLPGLPQYAKLVSYLKQRAEEIRNAEDMSASSGTVGLASHSSCWHRETR